MIKQTLSHALDQNDMLRENDYKECDKYDFVYKLHSGLQQT